MTYNLPVQHGNYQVVGINPAVKSLSILITVPEAVSVETDGNIEPFLRKNRMAARNYLVAEGFVTKDVENWIWHVGVKLEGL